MSNFYIFIAFLLFLLISTISYKITKYYLEKKKVESILNFMQKNINNKSKQNVLDYINIVKKEKECSINERKY